MLQCYPKRINEESCTLFERNILIRIFYIFLFHRGWIYRFGLVSLFNDISILVGYLMPKPFS